MSSNLSENIKNVIEFLSIEGVTGYEKNISVLKIDYKNNQVKVLPDTKNFSSKNATIITQNTEIQFSQKDIGRYHLYPHF